jgi:hypothetical protein
MFKQGNTKLPLKRIGPLAKALEVDPAHPLRLVMLEYMPETWESIADILQSTLLGYAASEPAVSHETRQAFCGGGK